MKRPFLCRADRGRKTQRIEIGLTGSKVVEWVENEESYLLGTTGQFAENEDGELVLKLEFAFLEEAARRKVKIIFQRDFERIRLEWNETPGKDLIIEGLESLVTDVAIAPLLPSRFRERSLDMIHLLMAQTIEPMVEAHRVRPGKKRGQKKRQRKLNRPRQWKMRKTQKKRCKNRKNQKRNVDKRNGAAGCAVPFPLKIQITDSKPYRRI